MVAIPIEVPDLVAETTGKPDLALIAAALRGDRVWSPEARRWLADLCEPPDLAPRWRLKVGATTRGQPPKRGFPRLDVVHRHEAEEERLKAEHGHRRRSDAEHATTRKFKISRSTLAADIAAVDAAWREHDAIIGDEHPSKK